MDKVLAPRGLLVAVVCAALPAADALGQGWQTVYQTDFSTNPGWVTDQPWNYFWEPVGELYHARTVNTQPGPSPTRYAYTVVDYDGGSFRVSFDFNIQSIEWSSGVMIGLYDSSLQIYAQPTTDPHFLYFDLGRGDGGRCVTVNARGLNGIHRYDQRWNLLSDNTWYRCTIEYDRATDSVVATIVRVDNGATVTTLYTSDFGGLPADLDRLGFARDPAGECCPNCSGYGCWASSTVLLDNMQMQMQKPGVLLGTGAEPGPLCVQTGEPVSVAVQVANLSEAINGVQALIHYDPALMTLNPTATVEAPGWSRVVLWDNQGDVVYALVYNGGSIGPGDGPFTVATLVFDPIAEGTARVVFRPDQLPFTTRLTKANDGGVIGGPDLFRTDSGVISIDDTVPTAANTGPACIGTPVQLLGGPDGMAGYLWVGPNGYTSTEQNPVIDPAVPGEYCLTVANAAGCTFGPVCTLVETFSCVTVSLEIPGLAHPVTRPVQFQLTDCEGSGELRTLPVSFTPIGNVGTALVLLTDVAPGTDWLSVMEGHTLRTLVAVNLNGGSTQVAALLRSGDLQVAAIPQDGLVDIVDFAILAARWGLLVSECSGGLPQECPLGADVTGDGMQDAADFAVIQGYFFQEGDRPSGCIMAVQADPLPLTGIGRYVETGRMIHATGPAVGPRQSISVAELAGKLPDAERADRNGDGVVDWTDVQIFRAENGL